MHWVYALKSSQTGCIYVGETTRLFRRWNEHQTGRGGVNTSEDDYDTIVGAYKVANNCAFMQNYDNLMNGFGAKFCQNEWGVREDKEVALELENLVTERYFYENKDRGCWWKVAGGRYTTEHICNNFYFSDKINHVTIDRPLCNHGYPCEVHMKNDKTKIYFTCPLPDWVEGVEDKCKFWKEFEPYRQAITNEKKQYEDWVTSLPRYQHSPCIKCNEEYYSRVWSRGNEYSICKPCFFKNYESLKAEYKGKFLKNIFDDE
jgi:hypothetical protein